MRWENEIGRVCIPAHTESFAPGQVRVCPTTSEDGPTTATTSETRPLSDTKDQLNFIQTTSPSGPDPRKTPNMSMPDTPDTPGMPGRPTGKTGRTQLQHDDLVRIKTLYNDARMGPTQIQKVTGYTINQVKYALKKKTATVGKRTGRPRKGESSKKKDGDKGDGAQAEEEDATVDDVEMEEEDEEEEELVNLTLVIQIRRFEKSDPAAANKLNSRTSKTTSQRGIPYPTNPNTGWPRSRPPSTGSSQCDWSIIHTTKRHAQVAGKKLYYLKRKYSKLNERPPGLSKRQSAKRQVRETPLKARQNHCPRLFFPIPAST